MIGTDFMGQVVITLSELPKGRESEQWYKLTPRNSKKDVVSGEVLVRILHSVDSGGGGGGGSGGGIPMLATASLGVGGVGGGVGGLAGAAGKRLADIGGGNGGGSSPSLLSGNGGGSTGSLNVGSARVIGEEEYSAMDDMRSGEIDLILPAILAHSASLPCLQIGLPAFAKWATTASVAERIAILDKYKGVLFEMLVGSANEFKSDGVVVFYSLLSFGPLLRLAEAKPYFTSTIASLLAGSLQEPPTSLLEDDRVRHCANCVIALSNACTLPTTTGKQNNAVTRKELKTKCAEILESSGALAVAVSLLTSSPSNPLNKLILALIIKVAHYPPALRVLHDNGFVPNVSKLLIAENDPVTLWVALDALAHYASDEVLVPGKNSASYASSSSSSFSSAAQATSSSSSSSHNGSLTPRSNPTYAEDLFSSPTLFASISRLASLDLQSIHGASLATGIIYLFNALSSLITSQNSVKIGTLDTQLIKLLTHSAAAAYLKFIPKNEQKSLVLEYSLHLLEKFGDAEGPQTQQQIGARFSETLKLILEFSRFPSVISRSKSYIDKLISWHALSKEEIIDFIQRERESHDDLDNSRRVISDLLAQL